MPSPVHPYSDYGVALRTLRTARSWLALMLFLCVLAQFIGFALLYWTQQPYVGMKASWQNTPSSVLEQLDKIWHRISPASQPAASNPARVIETDTIFPPGDQGRQLNIRKQWAETYTMAVPVAQLAGLIAICSQAIVVFVTLLVVLVAQAPGVAQITRSFIWSVLVLFMFLPWQYFAHDFPIPGVIYSFSELTRLIGPFVVGDKSLPFPVWLIYGRFLVWPLIGLFVQLIAGERYRAGILIAIGHPLQSMLQPRPPAPLPTLAPGQARPLTGGRV